MIPYSPLAGGWLSDRYRKSGEVQGPGVRRPSAARFDMSDPANQRKLDAAEQLAQLAEESGITLVELALAFVLNHPGGHRGDHRPAHDGPSRVPARRRGIRAPG